MPDSFDPVRKGIRLGGKWLERPRPIPDRAAALQSPLSWFGVTFGGQRVPACEVRGAHRPVREHLADDHCEDDAPLCELRRRNFLASAPN